LVELRAVLQFEQELIFYCVSAGKANASKSKIARMSLQCLSVK